MTFTSWISKLQYTLYVVVHWFILCMKVFNDYIKSLDFLLITESTLSVSNFSDESRQAQQSPHITAIILSVLVVILLLIIGFILWRKRSAGKHLPNLNFCKLHLRISSFLRSSFLHSFIPSFLHFFIPSFLHSFISAFFLFIPFYLHSFIPPFLYSFIYSSVNYFIPLDLQSSFLHLILSFIFFSLPYLLVCFDSFINDCNPLIHN